MDYDKRSEGRTSNRERANSTQQVKKQNIGTVKNLKVNNKNMRKLKAKSRLKKIFITGVVIAGLATGTYFGVKNYRDVQVPKNFLSTGASISVHTTLKDFENDFALVELNDWKKGVSDKSLQNIQYCEENNIPYGVVIESEADSTIQAKADAACANAILENKKLECPVYYDISKMCELLDSDSLFDVANTFIGDLSGKHKAGVCLKEEYLQQNGYDIDAALLVECDDKEISYNGDYDTCHFARTGEYFSSKKFAKKTPISPNGTEKFIKGIDVSQYQGNIDWNTVKSEDVNFAIIRFSSFYDYHETSELNIDDKFYENVKACEKIGMPYGIYCFSRAETNAEMKREVQELLQRLDEKNITPDLPIYCDLELEFHRENPKISAQLAKTFCSEIEKNGYTSGLYASYALVKDMVRADSEIKNMNKWVAWYRDNTKAKYEDVGIDRIAPSDDLDDIGNYCAVQVTDQAKIRGIDANTVDVNFANENIGKIY